MRKAYDIAELQKDQYGIHCPHCSGKEFPGYLRITNREVQYSAQNINPNGGVDQESSVMESPEVQKTWIECGQCCKRFGVLEETQTTDKDGNEVRVITRIVDAGGIRS